MGGFGNNFSRIVSRGGNYNALLIFPPYIGEWVVWYEQLERRGLWENAGVRYLGGITEIWEKGPVSLVILQLEPLYF